MVSKTLHNCWCKHLHFDIRKAIALSPVNGTTVSADKIVLCSQEGMSLKWRLRKKHNCVCVCVTRTTHPLVTTNGGNPAGDGRDVRESGKHTDKFVVVVMKTRQLL